MLRYPSYLGLLSCMVLFFIGCPTEDDPTPPNSDLDGDGYTVEEGDCDDSRADLNLDDMDDDGLSSCEDDCDDNDANSYPDAPEICDGRDNNCNGEDDRRGLHHAASEKAKNAGAGLTETAATKITSGPSK